MPLTFASLAARPLHSLPVSSGAPASLQGVMVGYAAGTDAYRILLPNNTIIVRCNARAAWWGQL
jgi:hypothetical protein